MNRRTREMNGKGLEGKIGGDMRFFFILPVFAIVGGGDYESPRSRLCGRCGNDRVRRMKFSSACLGTVYVLCVVWKGGVQSVVLKAVARKVDAKINIQCGAQRSAAASAGMLCRQSRSQTLALRHHGPLATASSYLNSSCRRQDRPRRVCCHICAGPKVDNPLYPLPPFPTPHPTRSPSHHRRL
jgi:hypothetical protein